MTPEDFGAWMDQEGLSVRKAAKALGVSPATGQDWRCGVKRNNGQIIERIDRRTALACAAISANLAPVGSGGSGVDPTRGEPA